MKQGKIPIKNIYYLLSYAWEFVGRGEEDFFSEDSFAGSGELLARIFDICLAVLARRGFVKGYEPRSDRIAGIRGKLQLTTSLNTGAFSASQAVCEFDEHTYDCHLNRVLKSAVNMILRDSSLSRDIHTSLKARLLRLQEVADIALDQKCLDSVGFNSHNKHYLFAIELSRLVLENMTVSNSKSTTRFQNFLENEKQMPRVFELFIRRFYEKQLGPKYFVSAKKFKWDIGLSSQGFADRVPELCTDVTIRSKSEVIVFDAKFYREALVTRYGTPKYRRAHLSQLMDYMRAAAKEYKTNVRGVLVYPTVSGTLHDRGTIDGFDVTIATVDLSSDWVEISNRLLALVSGPETESLLGANDLRRSQG